MPARVHATAASHAWHLQATAASHAWHQIVVEATAESEMIDRLSSVAALHPLATRARHGQESMQYPLSRHKVYRYSLVKHGLDCVD